jgi:ribosome-binding protein aMBF1 (putative translation factor)
MIASLSENEVGRRIRDARLAVGLSQLELAYRLSVSQSTVRRWESGAARPQRHLVPSMLRTLKVQRAQLFGE